ncbi:hypothetical protein R3P38DRAFT_2790246 [Favolaschia claudopus]|uniref:Uncharacterized protein n=1 Tax=Favolaschia claudopus TaxID=2862362 RepID=A0AAW0AJ77_9AGAR
MESELDDEEYEERALSTRQEMQLRERQIRKRRGYEQETQRLLALDTRSVRSTTVILPSLDDEDEVVQAFWRFFCTVMPTLSSLAVMSISYAHNDPLFLRRIINYGDVRNNTLPASLRTLHLKPLATDYTRRLQLAGPYAWHDISWRLEISLLPHVETLILSTPSYVFWPPTKANLEFTLAEWTAQMRCNGTSNLKEIIINSGFGDNGAIGRTWVESRMQNPGFESTDLSLLRKLDHFYGVQVVWLKGEDGNWVQKQGPPLQSISNRHEYFFGRSGWKVFAPFMTGDLELRVQQWREFRLAKPIAPGFAVMY